MLDIFLLPFLKALDKLGNKGQSQASHAVLLGEGWQLGQECSHV